MIRLKLPIKEVNHITVYYGVKYKFGIHKGVDFRTRCKMYPDGIGTPIVATADGEWDIVTKNDKYGNFVVLRHRDGYKTLYGHLNGTTYKNGYKYVKAGDVIGFGGNSGVYTTGPHLHFELKHNGKTIDPMLGIRAGAELLRWARARALMQVENSGEISFLTNGKVIKVNKDNCWDVISKNTWGISNNDMKDLKDLMS